MEVPQWVNAKINEMYTLAVTVLILILMEVPQWETNQGNIQKLKSGVLILILMEVPQWDTFINL